MPYSKTTWVEGTTGITAARLNNIESGVEVGYNNVILYAATTGSANAYIVLLNPAPVALTEGLCIAVKINVDSTSISTINVNGLGAKGIKKANGSDVTNLKAGGIYTLRYNGTNFQLLGEGGEYGTAGVGDVKVGVTFGTENGVATGTFTSDATAVASDLIAGKTAYVNGNKVTGAIPDRGTGGTKTPTASNITLSAGRYTTDIVISGVSIPVANVLTGTTIAGQTGTMPNAAGDTAALASTILGTTLKLRASKGYRDGVDDNVIISDANFIAGNIPNTKSIFGLQGTLEHVDINGIIASYNVLSGTINAGDFVSYVNMGALTVFRSGTTRFISAVQLEANKVLVVFTDESTYYGYASVLTISGTTITAGSVFTFNSYGGQYNSVCALSSTKAIVSYIGPGNTSVRARVLTISGTTISAGTELYLYGGQENCAYQYTSITAIDSTRAIVVWQQANNLYGMYQGHAMILSAPSTTITASSLLTFDGAGGSYTTVCKADTSKAVVVWGASGYVYAKVLVAGSGVAWGTHGSNQQWEGGPGSFSTYFSMEQLSAGKIIITYGDNGYPKTKIFNISGTTISFGTLYYYDATSTVIRGPSVVALDATNAAVTYETVISSVSYLVTTLLSVSGNVITKGTRSVLSSWGNTGVYPFIATSKSDVNTPVALYRNSANSNYGTGVVLPKNAVKKAVSPDVVLGIATTGGSAGTSISVKKAY